ncbi:MAG: branched-chain amino acid aminotransferase [Candidatus Poribacteria bacterium]|nr:branched-chain amino acid aminotransferase [Candidatus Poribacteria bacterium]MDE0503380.1 branched-chain amino acid aminotransferase [Candidatus Poribacteria bacterium]
MEIKVTKSTNPQRERPKDSELGFGKYTTDHMFLMDYALGKGWHDARIVPYQHLRLDPAAMVLHYNQEVFEGLKAYALANGGIGLFRPEKNIQRMNASAQRLVMPEVDSQLFLQAMKQLVMIDREWLPKSEGTSLYIRPTMIATEPMIGIRASERYLFYIILSPVGAYYPEGFNPTRIYVSDTHSRAAKHGVGHVKTSGNYGSTLFVFQEAAVKGYTQVLWLDANELKYIEEVGTSNAFFLIDDELITPPLEGTILPGITRDSAIQLATSWQLRVSERLISIDEVIDACRSGALKEMFATGTAAVISPVGEISYKGEQFRIADGKTGKLAQRLYDELTGIQYGRRDDPFGWRIRVD